MIIKSGILILLVVIVLVRYVTGTKRDYQVQVNKGLDNLIIAEEVISEDDLKDLPELVANYLRYTGVVGKNKISMFHADIDGEMRLDQTKEWAPITIDQTTYLNQGTRLFYMLMKFKGLPINGLHHFEAGKATMVIKILDFIKVADNKGPMMDQAETVTYFNDLCIFAPSALLDAEIVWEEVDDHSIKGTFTNEGISVSAVLYFDEDGKLTNFISNDRYAIGEDGTLHIVPWSTPIEAYDDFHGYRLVSKGEAIWHYPEGDFSYIRMTINDVVY